MCLRDSTINRAWHSTLTWITSPHLCQALASLVNSSQLVIYWPLKILLMTSLHAAFIKCRQRRGVMMRSTWILHHLSSITGRVLWKSQCITWRKWVRTSTSVSSQRPLNTPAFLSPSRRITSCLPRTLSIQGRNCNWSFWDSFKKPCVSIRIKRKMMKTPLIICLSQIRGNSWMTIAYSRCWGTCNPRRKRAGVRCTRTQCKDFSKIRGTQPWQN